MSVLACFGIHRVLSAWLFKPHELAAVFSAETDLRKRTPNTDLWATVSMSSGDVYLGILLAVSIDYDVLKQRDKEFSMVFVTRVLADGTEVRLERGERVIINTAAVDSIRLIELPHTARLDMWPEIR